jgi:hypothetical protein
VSQQSKRMLDLLSMADSVLQNAAHKMHLMCERSVVRPPPDLSDLSDSDDESSDGDDTATSAASASPEFPEPCDHVPDSSALRLAIQAQHGPSTTTTTILAKFLTSAPWDILLLSRECMPHLRCVHFLSLRVAGHTGMCRHRLRIVVRRRHGPTSLFMPRRWDVPTGKTATRRGQTTVYRDQHVTLLALAEFCILLRMTCAAIWNANAAAGLNWRPE